MSSIATRRVLPGPTDQFRADVLRGLRARPKFLPSKYFYDKAGAELFDQITALNEYYLTRTERSIMQQHVVEMAELIGPRCMLVEYGSGSSAKSRLLLDHLKDPVAYVPIDVSCEQLQRTARNLSTKYPAIEIHPVCADFTRPLRLPVPLTRPHRTVVYFPGSTIGNFLPDEAVALLRSTARHCGRNGALLLGADLRKDSRLIEAAYNDSQGITAAFNRNILARINRELEGDFVLDQFAHRAFFNSTESRIEMHLVSRRDQLCHVAGERFHFNADESIHTENSYKYSAKVLGELAEAGDFSPRQTWTDDRHFFSVQFLEVG